MTELLSTLGVAEYLPLAPVALVFIVLLCELFGAIKHWKAINDIFDAADNCPFTHRELRILHELDRMQRERNSQ